MVRYREKYGINNFSFVSFVFIYRNLVNMNFPFDAFCKQFSRFRHFHSAFGIETVCRYLVLLVSTIVLYCMCFFFLGFLRFSFLTRWIISEFWILFIIGALCFRSYICIENLSCFFSLAHCTLYCILHRIVPFQLPVHCSWWFWIIYDEIVFIMGLQSRDVVKLIFPRNS